MPKTQPGYFFVFLTGSVICTEHGTTLSLAPQYTTESFHSTGQGKTVQSGISSQHDARLLQEFPNVRAKHNWNLNLSQRRKYLHYHDRTSS